MRKIKSFDDRAMRKSTRIIAIAVGVIFTIFGCISDIRYAIPVGVVILLATIMQKETYITENGIAIEYDYIVKKHTIRWDFDEISDIHIETVKDERYYVLYFLKDVMSRRLVFYRDDIEDVLEMARTKNEKIHVAHVD